MRLFRLKAGIVLSRDKNIKSSSRLILSNHGRGAAPSGLLFNGIAPSVLRGGVVVLTTGFGVGRAATVVGGVVFFGGSGGGRETIVFLVSVVFTGVVFVTPV